MPAEPATFQLCHLRKKMVYAVCRFRSSFQLRGIRIGSSDSSIQDFRDLFVSILEPLILWEALVQTCE